MQDEDKVKDMWLWTTINSANQPYDFDGFRVFIWSLRHHRYETAFIQRHLVGYFPTVVDATAGTFGVCIEKDDGHRYRREYRLVEKQVKFAGESRVKGGSLKRVHRRDPEPKPPEGTLDKLKGKKKSIMK